MPSILGCGLILSYRARCMSQEDLIPSYQVIIYERNEIERGHKHALEI